MKGAKNLQYSLQTAAAEEAPCRLVWSMDRDAIGRTLTRPQKEGRTSRIQTILGQESDAYTPGKLDTLKYRSDSRV